MRKFTQRFLQIVIFSLLVVPAINFFSSSNPSKVKWKQKTLYNMDFALPPLTDLLYPFGISTSPGRVLIGHDGWLFLGNEFEHIIADGRRSSTPKAIADGERIGSAAEAWHTWLRGNGVKLYQLMIAPNKESIYPELMPFWARPLPPTATDALMAGTDSTRYLDLRAALKQAKATQPEALYFKTDTHWNNLGAGIAFRAFAQELAGTTPELRWPEDSAYEVIGMGSIAGTDLIRILWLKQAVISPKQDVVNPSPILGIEKIPVETTQYEFDSKGVTARKTIRTGGNPEVTTLPVLVVSNGALNAKKVLWLRDSFGQAMSPFMAATFREVLQVHVNDAFKSAERFAELVQAWRPEYVFVTVAERSARLDLFTTFPPSTERCTPSCTKAAW